MAVWPSTDHDRTTDPTTHVHPPPDHVLAPQPDPKLQPNRWRFYFPWTKTAVSAPTYNGEILLANRTRRVWMVWHNYHNLGTIEPEEERRVRLVRTGTISARLFTGGADAEFILLPLTPTLQGVEIVDMDGDEEYFTLRAIESGEVTAETLPESTRIRELGLSSQTRRALKRIGVTTLGQLRETDLGLLWDVRDGSAAYVELVEKFLLRDS